MAQAASLTRSGESAVLALYRIHISCTENYPEEGRCSLIRDTGHSFSSLVPSLDLKKNKKNAHVRVFRSGDETRTSAVCDLGTRQYFLVTTPPPVIYGKTMEEDQKKLLSESGREDSSDSIDSYGSAEQEPQEDQHEVAAEENRFAGNKVAVFLYKHRKKIPGYWTFQLILRPYPAYVLVMMLVAYLLNQLDRYTLPVVTTHVGAELHYGDKSCRPNPNIPPGVWNHTDLFPNATKQCTDDFLK